MKHKGNFKQWFNVLLVISEGWQGYESKAYVVLNHHSQLQPKKLSRMWDIPNFPTQGWADTAFCTINWNCTYFQWFYDMWHPPVKWLWLVQSIMAMALTHAFIIHWMILCYKWLIFVFVVQWRLILFWKCWAFLRFVELYKALWCKECGFLLNSYWTEMKKCTIWAINF